MFIKTNDFQSLMFFCNFIFNRKHRNIKDFFYRKGKSKETEVLCGPCRFGDLNTKATHFCKTCEDLEPLCEDCAQQHVRHKLCRGHEICDVIEELLDIKEALDKKYMFFNFIFFKFFS